MIFALLPWLLPVLALLLLEEIEEMPKTINPNY
jgi:hypothetical protein